jgi:hypothetical protein
MRRAASAADLARARIDAHRQQSRVRAGALIISLFGDAVARAAAGCGWAA